MAAFAQRPTVDYVEPDVQMTATLTPADPQYSLQWHYSEALAGMNLPTAWDTADGAAACTVAVVDTGITRHSDLAANVVPGYDFITNSTDARDGNGRDANPQDQGDWHGAFECVGSTGGNSSWHGTHVAGTIAAVTSNGVGVSGVAFKAKVQPVRVLGRCGGTLADIGDAVTWASGGTVSGVPANPTPAKVINMSLGGSGTCGAAYQNAINGAVARGTTVVVAAGNSNANAANYQPASCTNTVVVAASDRQGNRASYSNYGAIVDLTAPGRRDRNRRQRRAVDAQYRYDDAGHRGVRVLPGHQHGDAARRRARGADPRRAVDDAGRDRVDAQGGTRPDARKLQRRLRRRPGRRDEDHRLTRRRHAEPERQCVAQCLAQPDGQSLRQPEPVTDHEPDGNGLAHPERDDPAAGHLGVPQRQRRGDPRPGHSREPDHRERPLRQRAL